MCKVLQARMVATGEADGDMKGGGDGAMQCARGVN